MSYGTHPSSKYKTHTPNDTAKITYDDGNGHQVVTRCRGILLPTAGDVATKDEYGNTVVHPALVAGVIHPISTDLILDTGTAPVTVNVYF